MSDKVFLLGLGNQKCGTTWVHNYLEESPNFDGGFKKEYHIWDALDVPVKRGSRVSFPKAIRGSHAQRRRFLMQRCPQYYFNYFALRFRDGVTVTADITPSYSGLEKERLRFIRDGFAVRGIAVRPIIFIREPVSRIKSAVRYILDRNKHKQGIDLEGGDFRAALKQYYQSEHCRVRTNYAPAIEAATAVFGEKSLYIGVFESMFERTEIERMSDFMNVPLKPELSRKSVNKTRGTPENDPDLELAVKEAYRHVYDYCFKRCPQTQELWA